MNNQQVGRIVNFFRINHHFHEPYQLLLDGNFIKIMVERDIDLKRKFENATDGRVTLRVTSCILRELELLGTDFKLVLEEARKHKTIFCKHALEYSVDSCIVDQVGESNEKMYMVCSQDL
jgi:U3 small nucleolar RNA-associated protein 23